MENRKSDARGLVIEVTKTAIEWNGSAERFEMWVRVLRVLVGKCPEIRVGCFTNQHRDFVCKKDRRVVEIRVARKLCSTIR